MNEENPDDLYELFHIKNGRGEPACRANGGFFGYVDHELKDHPGLDITPEEYHDQQREQLRPSAFARLHLNEPASNEERFVTREEWDDCYDPDVMLLSPNDSRKAVYGVDTSLYQDYTAMVGVFFDQVSRTYQVIYCKVWKPERSELNDGKPLIDLSRTVKAEILKLHHRRQIEAVVYDPYQFSSISIDLKRKGVNMIEFEQTNRRIESDQGLYASIRSQELRHSKVRELTEHILNAVTVDSARGFRLAKEKSYKKIDAAVALSMALHQARKHRQSNFMDYIEGKLPQKLSHEEVSLETLMERADRNFWSDQNLENF